MKSSFWLACVCLVLTGRASAFPVYVFADHALHRFDSADGTFVNTVGLYNQVYGGDLQRGPDGLLYSLGDSGLWRIDPITGSGQQYIPFFTIASPVTSTPGGFTLAHDGAAYVFADNKLFKFDNTGAFQSTVGTYNQIYGGDIQFGPDGKLYALGDSGLWSIDPQYGTASEIIPFFTLASPVTSTPTAFTLNEQGIFIFSAHALHKFNSGTGAFVGTIGNYNQVHGDELQFAPDGSLHAIGDSGLWRINPQTGGGQLYLPFFLPGSPVQSTPGGFTVLPEPQVLLSLAAILPILALRRSR